MIAAAAARPLTQRGLRPVAAFYALHFAAVGIQLPFLPPYFKSLGLNSTQVGLLLAAGPLMILLAPPLWGRLADRSGDPGRVLGLLGLGASFALATVAAVEGFALLAVAMLLYGFFNAGVVPLIDTITFARTEGTGTGYARIRLFGSLGFVASSVTFGFTQQELGPATILIPLAFVIGWALLSLLLRGGRPRLRRPIARSPRHRCPTGAPRAPSCASRDLAFLVGACALHWIANAPYNGSLGIHLAALGLAPAVLGLAAATGVLSEVLMLLGWERWGGRLSPRAWLALSFLLSAVRWLGMAWASSPTAFVLLSVLHAFTFGAFYVAAVTYIASRVPAGARASGQGQFTSIAFGLGGLVGFALGGLGYDHLGGRGLFVAAAVVEVLAVALVLNVRAPRASAAPALPAAS